jgi:hypothetical protein
MQVESVITPVLLVHIGEVDAVRVIIIPGTCNSVAVKTALAFFTGDNYTREKRTPDAR